jgi:hypothetical protein
MLPYVKVRGIYSTALTKLALDSGFHIAEPSEQIRERFHMDEWDDGAGRYDILIKDREDFQGIEVIGEADHLCELLKRLQGALLDAVIVSFSPSDDSEPLVVANVEFPGWAKEKLDRIRSRIAPTLKNHHRFKIIDSELLESAEIELSQHPEERVELEKRLFKESILEPLIGGRRVKLEHIKPSGKPMRPRLGELYSVRGNRVVFKREFSGGQYDGLNLPINPGDYGLTEVREGKWFTKHSYFSKEHLLIGEYFNINTPTELYPYGARYVDLEVDVIQRAGENAFAIDREKLEVLARKGCVSEDLHTKVLLVSERLLRGLNRSKAKDLPER